MGVMWRISNVCLGVSAFFLGGDKSEVQQRYGDSFTTDMLFSNNQAFNDRAGDACPGSADACVLVAGVGADGGAWCQALLAVHERAGGVRHGHVHDRA